VSEPRPAPAPAASRPSPLRAVRPHPAVDLPAAERAVAQLLRALGRDPASPHLADPPPAGSPAPSPSCSPPRPARVPDLFARDLQVQERLRQQVADRPQDASPRAGSAW